MGIYAGNADNFPDEVTIADDSAPPTAAAFNPGLEGALDRTAFLAKRALYLASQTITSTAAPTSVVVPYGATHAFYEGCGGGGGGASGTAAPGSGKLSCGGAGGGGAVLASGLIQVVAGETLSVVIGQGGSGGAGGIWPGGANKGNSGSDTQIVRVSDSGVLATMLGAGGGSAGSRSWFDMVAGGVTRYQVAAGGAPVRGSDLYARAITDEPTHLMTQTPQAGGRGRSGNDDQAVMVTERGAASPQGFAGGLCAGAGGPDGTYKGGGGGGGGGAGPYGNGGDGGHGGHAHDGAAGEDGVAGVAAAANSGGGGGGGGSSGGSSSAGSGSTAGAGGSGAPGGSGRVTITFFRKVG